MADGVHPGDEAGGVHLLRLPRGAGGGAIARNLVVHRSAHAFTCLNRFPYNSGHVMVIPRAHVADLDALAPEAFADLQAELRRAVRRRPRAPTGRRG